MSLPVNLLIVNAVVDAAVEDEWNHWYDRQHLPEILGCPGFRSGRRYCARDQDGARRYVAVYELDGPQALDSEMFKARRGWGPFAGQVRFETMLFAAVGPDAAGGGDAV